MRRKTARRKTKRSKVARGRAKKATVRWVIGYTWKTRKKEICPVCGCKSNLWKITRGDRGEMVKTLICPGNERYPHSHQMLEERIKHANMVGFDEGVFSQEIETARFKFRRI